MKRVAAKKKTDATTAEAKPVKEILEKTEKRRMDAANNNRRSKACGNQLMYNADYMR